MPAPVERNRPGPDARTRILDAAYQLFSRRGVHAVGVDEIVQRSGVAKATLYKHFASKDALVIAFLEQRDEVWIRGFIEAESAARATDPAGQLLAIFDVLNDWFHRNEDFDGSAFIKILLEMGREHPIGAASAQHLANLRQMIAERAIAAGLTDPEGFAFSWQILMKGSVISAASGDSEAAMRAKALAQSLIELHRP